MTRSRKVAETKRTKIDRRFQQTESSTHSVQKHSVSAFLRRALIGFNCGEIHPISPQANPT
jgi:hypothetical protein